ncbi:MAG: ABC transporter permease, partial [Bacteroidetes bacterium]
GFILLIACINFMNLSTARSEKRAKEVGIRKVVGAGRKSLISQFLGESILIAVIAGLLAVIIVELSLPGFNKLTNKTIYIQFENIYFWFFFLGFIFFTGIIAGSYPAFYLSAFRPVRVLKGAVKKANALVTPRKILVITQFTFAIILIVCTIIIKQQIQYARDRQTGYDKANLIYAFLGGDVEKNYEMIKNDLLQSGIATSITKTSAPLTQGWSNSWGFQWDGKDPNDRTIIDRFCADDHFARTAGLQIVNGRDIDLKQFITDSTAVLLNESAAKVMGFKQPIGQIVKDNGIDWHVVGVFKDFILQSPYYPTVPMVIEGAKGWFNVMHIKLNEKNSMEKNMKAVTAVFNKYNPAFPFFPQFVDQEYAAKFKNEQRVATLATLFAGLTIFISCLGLFGLSTYTAENRIKEIGIRKVLGASVTGITSLLSRDFVTLVFISILIATPIAWWAMFTWLKDFPYHISVQWWVFALAGVLSLSIALLTVSFQAIKAALANPVRSLRTE